MTCQSCSPHCLSCLNSTYCSQCDSTAYLFNSSCLAVCPAGTYTSASSRMCIDCPTGCMNCSGSSQCFTCFDKFYFNASLGFCFSCNSVCLTCDGPGQTQCKSCASPLFLKGSSCSVLSCPMGTYVDPLKGCLSCNSLFAGASSCNSTVPFGCG
jgi:proprotein convertase subtilisin/kexin type 5